MSFSKINEKSIGENIKLKRNIYIRIENSTLAIIQKIIIYNKSYRMIFLENYHRLSIFRKNKKLIIQF